MTHSSDQIIPSTILIVGDKPIATQLLVDILTGSRYIVKHLNNQPNILTEIKQILPDLILLDIDMRAESNYTLCQQLKTNHHTTNTPIIVISNYNEVPTQIKSFQYEGFDYITKPFRTQEVLTRINNQLTIQILKRDLEEQNRRLQLEVNYRLQAEIELQMLLQSMTDIILIYDGEGNHLRTVSTHSRFPQNVLDAYHLLLSNQVENYAQFIRIAIATQESVCDVEYELTIAAEGLWFSANISPLANNTAIWVAREITGRKAVEADVVRTNSFLNAQMEVDQDGILLVDNQGRIISYNQLFLAMWQLKESVLLANQHHLIIALLQESSIPEALIESIEQMYLQAERTLQSQIQFGDKIFDCYARSVHSPSGKFYGVSWFFRDITEYVNTQKALQLEKEKTDQLLLNILPVSVAAKLKEGASIVADAYQNVSVLFADIVGFSTIAIQLSPTEIVSLLNKVFSEFDALAEKHNLEKIKTIGDEYMVVGGAPNLCQNHLESTAYMAIDMLQSIRKFTDPKGAPLDLRIGVHCGPVVAGVIGTKKFSYDLWGDTVNLASRMESQGTPSKIQVTEAVYEQLKDKFSLELRGKILIKGHSLMPTYWLLNR